MIVFDVELVYDGGAEICLKLHRSRFLPLKLGIRDFKFHGTVRCEIRNPPGVDGTVYLWCAIRTLPRLSTNYEKLEWTDVNSKTLQPLNA